MRIELEERNPPHLIGMGDGNGFFLSSASTRTQLHVSCIPQACLNKGYKRAVKMDDTGYHSCTDAAGRLFELLPPELCRFPACVEPHRRLRFLAGLDVNVSLLPLNRSKTALGN